MSLDHLALLTADIDAFIAAVATGPGEAEIAGCPGWTLTQLGVHLGSVQRWARHAILHHAPPQPDDLAADPAPTEHAELPAWLRAGADRLLVALHELDPAGPTWHPFPVEPKVAGLWRRRQAQEASVHRWDAQRAVGLASTIDSGFADDGVDEYWTVMLPRMLTRESKTTPASVLAVSLTDTGRSWTVDGQSGLPVIDSSATAAAQLSGPAEAVLLRLWGRPVPEGSIVISGDAAVAADWLELGGA